jgi:hypothetical protein
MVSLIRDGNFTPSEVRESVMLASIIEAETRVHDYVGVTIPHTEELEAALQTIFKVTEKLRREHQTVNDELLEACKRFVWKCDNGLARSSESYKQMVEAIAKAEGK